jgi:hypothetical protein
MNYSKLGVLDETPKVTNRNTEFADGHEAHFATRWLLAGAFFSCLTWAILMATVGWNNTLSDQHGFRQSQTAITSYYFVRGGPLLDYETPVLGRPWSVPFEFPLYQWLVAGASSLFNAPLNQTGRFISELFFYLSLVPIWFLLAELCVRPVHRLVFLCLILVSPLYVFWSRTFMIESTAFFFCIGYLFFTIRYVRDCSRLSLFLGGTLGVLGALVKTTTISAFVIVASLFYILTLRNQRNNIKLFFSKYFVPFVVFLGLPLLATVTWTHYTDEVKSLNVVGLRLTSWQLARWNFGPLSLRFSSNTWATLFSRTVPELLGGDKVLFIPLLGICFAHHRLFPFLACVVGFLSPFLIFTNLHVVHNYYTYANGIFLIAALSWCVVGLLERGRWKHILGMVIFFVMILVSVRGYYKSYHTVQKNNVVQLENVARVINRIIQPEEMMLVFGLDWSSELPYYSERRALMWPEWMSQHMDSPEMKEALSKLGNTHVGAMIACNSTRTDSQLITTAISVLKFAVTPTYEDSTCSVYTSPGTVYP